MRHFHICCDGSFGNRLSGLIGGLTLARLAGLQPKVSWAKHKHVSCSVP